MALLEVNFFSKALMRPVTMNVILPADKVFFEEETEEDNKPFKTLYLLHGWHHNCQIFLLRPSLDTCSRYPVCIVSHYSVKQICSIWIIRM